MRALYLLLLLVACGDPPKQLVVTVEAQASVRDAKVLHVTLANAGGTVSQDLDLGARSFPVTFGVEPTGRVGALGIAVDALDENMLVVGRGAGTSDVMDLAASVQLEGADFVVNTDFADDQQLNADAEVNGYQITAQSDGTWTAAYHGACGEPCHMLGRRFDATGKALDSAVAAGTNAFALSTTLTGGTPQPAVVANGATTLAFWDFADAVTTTSGVACRALDAEGNATTTQLSVATESSDVVAAVPLSNSNFAVSWISAMSSSLIRGVIVKPDCKVAIGPYTISTTTAGFIHRPTVGVAGDAVLYAWIVDGSVRFRVGTNGGVLAGGDAVLLPATATMGVDHVRLASFAGGFAVAARWAPLTGAGASRIEVYKADKTGKIEGTSTVITTVNVPQFESIHGFGMAPRADGALMVVWDECNDGGDGNGCGVFARLLRPTGVPVGDKLVIPTTVLGDQSTPSVASLPGGAYVVGWTDKSEQEPDRSGLAVRARIVIPPYDSASGILGAACSDSAPCDVGLACARGTDNMRRCFETCTPPTCANGGVCKSVDGAPTACIF